MYTYIHTHTHTHTQPNVKCIKSSGLWLIPDLLTKIWNDEKVWIFSKSFKFTQKPDLWGISGFLLKSYYILTPDFRNMIITKNAGTVFITKADIMYVADKENLETQYNYFFPNEMRFVKVSL